MPATDRELLMAAAAGEEAAFATLYHRYAPELRDYFLRAGGGGDLTADDLVQQVFIQLLGSRAYREADRGPERLNKLLFTIARNLVRNTVRNDSRRQQRERTFARQTGEADTPPDRTAELRRALDQLPPAQRQPLLLRYRHGLSVDDIARLTDSRPGTIKSRLHYGLRKLATLLSPHSEPHPKY